MADYEDDDVMQHLGSEPQGDFHAPAGHADEEEDYEQDDHAGPSTKEPRRSLYEDDEDEDDDEEEEEEEEEGGAGEGRPKKRTKHRHKKRNAVNRFLDVEAEVDEDEEEDEDEEAYVRDEFIEEGGDGVEDVARRAADHARLDRRDRELDDQDLARIAEDMKKRYTQSAVRYTGDMSEIPQRLLMPSVMDANLWQVRVRPNKERDIVFSLMRKAIDLEYTNRPLQILSAFQRDSLPGMIYVEARSSKQVSEACNGLVGVYPSRGITLVPIEEMASLLQIKKQDLTVTPGSWVRIKRGKYQGDLAQVMDITENGEEVGLKFIPRIDLNPKDDLTVDGKKRKKLGLGTTSLNMRPPQRFFNYEEVVKVYGRKMVSKRNQVYVFQNDTYKDGFIEKDFRLSALQLDDVSPTLDEITRFTKGMDGGENEGAVDLSIIAEASRKAAIAVLQPGDHVEVFEGEQSGAHGVVQSIEGDIVSLTAKGLEIDGTKIEVPARSVRKRFKPGDHVKVMTGKNADETGLVVSVAENVVTFLSDMSMQEVSVFSKDLREAAEVGSGTNIVGNYELHDLVQLDLQTVGVIYKTERDSFRVLDQNGQVRLVQPHQISMRRDSNRAIATDSEGHELRVGDNVKEVDGEGRKGRVIHTHQSHFAFLHNRDIVENGGVFVTRARSLASLAPKGNLMKLGNADLSKMNPAMSGGASGGMVGSGMGRGPRDRLIGVLVVIVKGSTKGHIGTIKDTNGNIARVELHSNNKIIMVDKDKLKRYNPMNKKTEPLESGFSGGLGGGGAGPGRTPQWSQPGGRTPGWGAAQGRTPNPYAGDGKTPAWNASSRTPNPYALDGGKTPAWNASSRTPNPYAQDGGRTPAWNASSRTPNPYAAGGSAGGWGNATPRGAGGWGGATPRQPAWGGATPSRSAGGGWGSGQDSWGENADSWQAAHSAATPAAAPTPANAPTPGLPTYQSVKTPGWDDVTAPTPGASGFDETSNETSFEVPKDWLLDPTLPPKKGMFVKIQGSRGPKPWFKGEKEGLRGVVDIVQQGSDYFASTAMIWFPDSSTDPLTVPVEYLVPVPPERVGNRVMGLDGEHKGETLTTVDVDGDIWNCTAGNTVYHYITGDRLVLLHED
ncbi:hypothetical protein JAAARDRAFT_36254 [Jaapia argillacea MUCL 33604]|uniref:Transcription elongation factor SPT5 n=1 Tax=Jaapia argillacea MUCL 33604 TaxID=933084 RepID=A0A067PSF7_9AGAM|nr:hypothetical protein JAAARDRAFT_36254 [Jaapia argillacea MUCL 33604]